MPSKGARSFRKRLIGLGICFLLVIVGTIGTNILQQKWRLGEEVVMLWLGENAIPMTGRTFRVLQQLSVEELSQPDLGEQFRNRFNDPDAPADIQSIFKAYGGPQGTYVALRRGFGIYHVHIERFGTAFETKKDPWRWQVFMMLPDENGIIKRVAVKNEALARQIIAPLLKGRNTVPESSESVPGAKGTRNGMTDGTKTQSSE